MTFRKTIHFFKTIAYFNRFLGGDMSYPPFSVWEKNIKFSEIKKAWDVLEKISFSHKDVCERIGLYVHIPFCKTKCFYCNCISFPELNKKRYDIYLQVLKKEISILNLSKAIKIDTLYIGGGTPSILSPRQLKFLLDTLYQSFNLIYCAQIMVEISPYTCSLEKIKILKAYNVNKVTIGVQTLDPKVLKKMCRPQEEKEVFRCYHALRNAGIKYINIDLMVGLPGQTLNSFVITLKKILELKPDTIHLNPFFPACFTPFYRLGNKLSEREIVTRQKMLEIGRKIIDEIYPFAFEKDELEKENRQLFNSSKYNTSLLGIGWGAISHIRNFFHYGKGVSFDEYIASLLKKNELPKLIGYKLSLEEEMRANIIQAFEREQMLKIEDFERLFKKDPLKVFKKEFEILFNLGKLKKENGTIFLRVKNRIEPFIYSKFFYNPKVLQKLKKVLIPFQKRIKNIDKRILEVYEI